MSRSPDPDTLRAWVDEGLTDEQIAGRLGLKEYRVARLRRDAGILRPRGR
jgi:hypothetical protein